MKNPVLFLRRVARLEAYSYLVLLFVAMPLKYLAAMPAAVKAVGSLHGALFVLFCAALLQTVLVAGWPLGRSAAVFLSSLLPFGPLLLDARLARYAQEFQNSRS